MHIEHINANFPSMKLDTDSLKAVRSSCHSCSPFHSLPISLYIPSPSPSLSFFSSPFPAPSDELARQEMKVVREAIGADAAADLTILRRKTIESLAVKAGYPPEEGEASINHRHSSQHGEDLPVRIAILGMSKTLIDPTSQAHPNTENSRVAFFVRAFLRASAVSSGAMAVFLRERNNVELFDGVQGEIRPSTHATLAFLRLRLDADFSRGLV